MHTEYKTIIDAGLLVQLDDARAAVSYDRMVPPKSLKEYRAWLARQVEITNHAIKGLPPDCPATIATLSDRLQIQHQSAVELIDRLEAKALVHRTRDEHDRRCVLISLTEAGEQELAPLVNRALHQLTDTGHDLLQALHDVIRHATRS